MREIKFRAWTGKEYDYDICLNEEGKVIDFDQGLYTGCFNEYVVEQYTGLKDKNGKEIYEGDITDPDDCIYAVCEFQDGSFGWLFYEQGDPDPIEFDTMTSLLLDKVEIIGNIHENPELLI